jgi:hypothetical protein
MTRVTAVSPRGVARSYDVPGTIAGVAAAISAAQGGELAVATSEGIEATLRTSEIVMLQLLDFREPVVQPVRD